MAAFKIPAKVAVCADLLREIQMKKAVAQKVVDELDKQESLLEAHLIEKLKEGEAEGVIGKISRVWVEKKPLQVVRDWDKFWPWVIKNKCFEAVQKRANVTVLREHVDAGEKIPGTEKILVPKVHCLKR